MTREDFMRIFIDVSNKIISFGIDKGYFDPSKKEKLENKLRNIINKDIQYLDDSQGLAYFNPNNQILGFNINQITTEGDAITLILHEEKHILDQHIDWDNTKHIDNSHVGFHQQHSGIGIGQNESITDRFAIEMAKSFTNNNIRTTLFDTFNLIFQTDMVRYQVEDKLNQLFCKSIGITLDELISMQNDEKMDRLNELISRFNEFADYDRYSAAIDGIYELRYGANGKKDTEFTEEDIRKMHEYIQLAQNEFEKYITQTTPEKLEDIKGEFITIDTRYKIDDERKNDLVNRIHGSKPKETSDSSLADIFSMLRMDLEDDSKTQSLQLNGQIQKNKKELESQTKKHTKSTQDLGKKLTEEVKKNFLKWSEGNKYLYELLCKCWENKIRTFASCGGHEEENNRPYIGIIIDNNSLPIIKSILAQVQDMQNIAITSDARHLGNGKLLSDEELRGLVFYAHNYNCCELFYKMKKGIETKERDIALSPKVSRFYELLKELNATSREELQASINDNVIVGSAFSTPTQDFIDFENSKKMVRNSKIIRFFRKLLPFKKLNTTRYENLQQKYGFLQREYAEERITKMEQYRIENSNGEIERNAISQSGSTVKAEEEINKSNCLEL